MSEQEMTDRVCRAMTCPYMTILGHPTGRLLLAREAYAIDLDRVFETAAANGVAIEINADPHRLDLDWRVLGRARAAGVTISIGADAHNVGAWLRRLRCGHRAKGRSRRSRHPQLPRSRRLPGVRGRAPRGRVGAATADAA